MDNLLLTLCLRQVYDHKLSFSCNTYEDCTILSQHFPAAKITSEAMYSHSDTISIFANFTCQSLTFTASIFSLYIAVLVEEITNGILEQPNLGLIISPIPNAK